MSRAKIWIFLAIAAMALTIPAAQAVPFDLNVLQCGCLPAGTSAGTVDIQLSGTTATFTVTLSSGLQFHDEGLTSFAFNGPSGLTIDLLSLPTGWSVDSSPNNDGLKGSATSFSYNITCTKGPNGCTPNTSSITFTVSGVSSLASIETRAGNGGTTVTDFEANIAVINTSGCTGVVGAGNGTSQSTASGGFTGASPCTSSSVPEPTSIAFFGSGLIGLGFVLRKRFTKDR